MLVLSNSCVDPEIITVEIAVLASGVDNYIIILIIKKNQVILVRQEPKFLVK